MKLQRLFAGLLPALAVATALAVPLRGQLVEGEKVVTVVNSYWVKVRSEPVIAPEVVVGKVAGGTQLKLLEATAGWYRVELADGLEAWIASDFAREDEARDLLKVTADVARVRREPTVDSRRVGSVIKGLGLEPLGRQDDWYRVRMHDGVRGWVREDLVELVPVVTSDSVSVAAELAAEPTPEALPAREPAASAAPLSVPAPAAPSFRARPAPLPPTAFVAEAAVEPISPRPAQRPGGGVLLLVSMIPGVSLLALVIYVMVVVLRSQEEEHEAEMKRALPPSRLTDETPRDRDPLRSVEAELAALDQPLEECLELLRDRCRALLAALDGEGFEPDEMAAQALVARGRLASAAQELAVLQSHRVTVLQKLRRPLDRESEGDVVQPSDAGSVSASRQTRVN